MVKHIIAYRGVVKTSLGIMLEAYAPIFVPVINLRVGIEGTLLGPPYSLEDGREFVRDQSIKNRADHVFAVIAHKKKPRYIGHMGIHKINKVHGFATSGSVLLPEGQGNGHGTEAKLLLLYHAFMVLGLRKLTSTVKTWNAQSLGHLVKCGYKVCGTYRKHHFHEGEFIDEHLLEVFREDWEPIWKKYQKKKKLPKLTDEQEAYVRKVTKS